MMEDGAFTPNIMLSESTIDSNLMDELLYDGFWLETTNGSNFWKPVSTRLSNLNPLSLYFPNSEANLGSVNTNLDQESFLQEMDEFSAGPSVSLGQSENILVKETEVNRSRVWIGPNRSPISVKKRLVQAVNCLKESISDKDVLVQIWIPVKRGSRQVLTTNNQPFSLNPNCKNLAEYRDVSANYHFAVDHEDSKEFMGLPGRVFLNKLPEWTPDVRFFKREEYPRVNHAQHYDVRGSLGLPVFEQGSGVCLGVVEIVTTSQKVDFSPELENVCKALEAVDLKSSGIQNPYNVEDWNERSHGALTEIKNVLKFICDTHKLPLAQTWASCVQQHKGGCRHSDENYKSCVSTIDSACYVADPQVSGFHEACSEHHLLKGEGVVGKAFQTNRPCFLEDITALSKTEYPLAHYARVFNLCASAAIPLRSTYNGTADFVLEFFLPVNCNSTEDQMLMLNLLSSAVQQNCQSLRVITDHELAQESSTIDKKLATNSPSKESSKDTSSGMMSMGDIQHKGKGVAVSLDDHEGLDGEFEMTNEWGHSGLDLHHNQEHEKLQQDSGSNKSADGGENFSLTIGDISLGAKTSNEKRRMKTEKTISLQVLRQYFSGSLKEAAKSIGVCPTTLKRICRQHGITRWPSRKIKKVGHSLRKLQLVIDSVQGAEGSIKLSSFYNNFPELISPNVPRISHLSSSNISGHLQQVNKKSPSSSGSHSSSSSLSCSTGVKQSSIPINGDALSAEETKVMLNRARSEAELHVKGQEETKLLMRSYSHKILSDHALIEAPALPKNSNQTHLDRTFKVKVAFGEEKIRFSLQPQWGFKDLQEEVLRRFNIDDISSVSLKYLDDDAEWVLLTCDADLEECTYVHRSSKNRMIKLAVNQVSHPNLGSSFGSNVP